MLIEQRMKEVKLTPNENLVASYILSQQEHILDKSTRDIAKETYTSSSTVVRLAQKLGYQGFEDLKEAFRQEISYSRHHFQDIDANIPFTQNHNIMQIASIMSTLMKETADDTQTLFHHDTLQKAVQLLNKAEHIYIFAIENNMYLAELFKYKMLRIGKSVHLETFGSNQTYYRFLVTPKDCALCISYSGESKNVVENCQYLHEHHIPTIAITSIGNNQLKKYADVALEISTREKLHSKISNFTVEFSLILLLDVLYSCIYALDYEQSSKLRIERTKVMEKTRYSSLDIIQENEK